MHPTPWIRLQLYNRPPDPHPHELPVPVATVEHLVGALGCEKLGIGTEPTYDLGEGEPKRRPSWRPTR